MTRRGVLMLASAGVLAAVLGTGVALVMQARLGGGRAEELAFDRLYAGDRPVVRIGEVVPAFELPGLADGTRRRLPAPGRPMLIAYWASWCAPCREEMPLLSAFAREQGATGVQVVGIALDDPAEARAYLAQRPAVGFLDQLVEPPETADSSEHLGNLRGLLPFAVLVDAQGALQHRKTGAFSDARELERWVAAGLPDSPADAQTVPN